MLLHPREGEICKKRDIAYGSDMCLRHVYKQDLYHIAFREAKYIALQSNISYCAAIYRKHSATCG